MAEATSAGAMPLISGLLDEIVIWEILVRLPPEALLRCRAVSRAWRLTTSRRDLLLAHHARQPAPVIVSGHNYGGHPHHRDIMTLDHRAAQLQHVARLDERYCSLVASYDGLLLLFHNSYTKDAHFSIYNPATRQSARLPVPRHFMALGMYPHSPTCEYRLLFYDKFEERLEYDKIEERLFYDENEEIDYHDVEIDDYDEETYFYDTACYIFALGSIEPSRKIGCSPEAEQVLLHGGATAALLFRGNLHWQVDQDETESNKIVVFNTTTESFRKMHAPVVSITSNVPGYTDLLDMDGMLTLYSCNEDTMTIDISVLQNYESEVWTFKYKIEMPVTEIKMLFGQLDDTWYAVVIPEDGELLVLVQCAGWLLQIDMDGKLVATFHRNEVRLTKLQLKKTLVPHTFFPTLE